jgi:hypothetical protein
MDKWEGMATYLPQVSSNANAIKATSDDIEALWDEVIIDIDQAMPSSRLSRALMNDNFC